MRSMGRTAGLVIALALVTGCSPELGSVPFACAENGACPSGYQCQATVCVREGEQLPASHPARVYWIGAAHLDWFARDGGATLVYNDGYTPGGHGIYALDVSSTGLVTGPNSLLRYGDEFPMSSAVVELDDGRYGVATRRFPNVEGDDITLEVLGIERNVPEGTTPAIESLYTETTPFLGGTEPPYLSATSDGVTIDLAFTVPTQGGLAKIVHLERAGSVWKSTRSDSEPLPSDIPPLSGDSLLWPMPGGGHTLRVGFETFAVASIDAQGTISPFTSFDDVPIYAFDGSLLTLRYGDYSIKTASWDVSFVLTDMNGNDSAIDEGWVVQDALEFHTGTPYGNGALIAPLSKDPAFPTIDVGFYRPGAGLSIVPSIERQSTEPLYSARAFVSDGKLYVAWTELHESFMDLWIAVTDAGGLQ